MDAKKKAVSLIRRFHTNDPFTLASALGIHILYSDLGGTWGCCTTYKRIKFIHINTEISEEKQKFTCAHELGHAVLHPGMSLPYLKAHTLFSPAVYERQANTFAVELLLPDILLREYPDCTLDRLAKFAGLPPGMSIFKTISAK
nr:MAG TPA: IrrE protein [Caudoviricetes sp.]